MKSMNKIIIAAVGLSLLTVLLLNLYIKNLQNTYKKQVTRNVVLVAKETIPANVKITSDMVKVAELPAEAILPNALTSSDKIIGSVSKSEIVQGEQILSNKLVTDIKEAVMSYRIKDNMRAATIPVDEASGVGGYLSVGDKVDLLITYDPTDSLQQVTTCTELQNIEVLAIGSGNQNEANKSDLPTSVTLLVSPIDAETIAYGAVNGTFQLTLRNPVDNDKVQLPAYNSSYIK